MDPDESVAVCDALLQRVIVILAESPGHYYSVRLALGLGSTICCVPTSVAKNVDSHVIEKSELREGESVFQGRRKSIL